MGALCLIATLYDFIFIMMTPDPEEEAEPHMNGHAHSNGDLRKDGEGEAADTEILIHPQVKNEAPKHSKSSSNTCSKCLFLTFDQNGTNYLLEFETWCFQQYVFSHHLRFF